MFLYLWLKHDHEAPCKLLCFISYRLFPGETLTMMRVTMMPFTVDDLEAAGHDGSYAERINCALSGREWGKMMCNLTLSSPILMRSLLFIWLKSSCYYQTLYASELSVRTGKAKVCTAPFFSLLDIQPMMKPQCNSLHCKLSVLYTQSLWICSDSDSFLF